MGIGNEGKLGISLTIFQTSPAMFSLANLIYTALERNVKLDFFNQEKYWSIRCVKST